MLYQVLSCLKLPDSNSEKLVLAFEYFQGNVAEGSNRLDRSYFYYIYPHRKIQCTGELSFVKTEKINSQYKCFICATNRSRMNSRP